MHAWASRLKGCSTSIALVEGRAVGGGFEMALSTDHIIAEERSEFGFPEIMLGLFPCTGAMGLLPGRVGARQAERMMTNKRIYKARELFEMSVIDEICRAGEGELAVERFIARHEVNRQVHLKVRQSRYRQAALNYDEGVVIVDDWVELAMNLTPQQIRNMEMLIMLQESDPAARQQARPETGESGQSRR
ncbi:MAG TPA: enoyl-CoA hydratase-related protein [Pseudoxanthomonas sp.]|nr:enoyl-CoA hydratase-related protein [Pseudoxanthomonas sp.]